jgi:uncharacterized protein
MLIEFRVANFLSFEDVATLSMAATADQEHEKNNVLRINDKQRLLKSAVIYGANAAGKSNFIGAMDFMRAFVLFAPKLSKRGAIPDLTFKLNKKSRKEPSYFEVVFFQDMKRFRYGFEILNNKVVTEWLFYTPTTKEALLFTRNEEEGITLGPSFKEAKGLEGKAKENRLFLTRVAEYNGDEAISQTVVNWFKGFNVMRNLDPAFSLDFTLHMLERHGDRYKAKLLRFLRKLGVLDDFEVRRVGHVQEFPEDMPKEVQAYFKSDEDEPSIIIKRKVYEDGKVVGTEEFDLMEYESEGTKKLFAFAGAFLHALEHGKILVVDELESSLHPLITRTIIELFNSEKSIAQLIFATHDTNLLSNRFFRRDQIWFVEKSSQGSSCLFSLAEYKEGKPRKDASFGKDYVLGKYGAIPFLGNFDDLIDGKRD